MTYLYACKTDNFRRLKPKDDKTEDGITEKNWELVIFLSIFSEILVIFNIRSLCM